MYLIMNIDGHTLNRRFRTYEDAENMLIKWCSAGSNMDNYMILRSK